MVPHCIDRYHFRSDSLNKHLQLDPIRMWMQMQCQLPAGSVCMQTMHIRPVLNLQYSLKLTLVHAHNCTLCRMRMSYIKHVKANEILDDLLFSYARMCFTFDFHLKNALTQVNTKRNKKNMADVTLPVP